MKQFMNRMMVTMSAAAAVTGLALLAQTANQSADQAQKTPPVIKGGAEEVVMDVIVRDKHGKTVTDLTPQDFEITDNGEKALGDLFPAGAGRRSR